MLAIAIAVAYLAGIDIRGIPDRECAYVPALMVVRA